LIPQSRLHKTLDRGVFNPDQGQPDQGKKRLDRGKVPYWLDSRAIKLFVALLLFERNLHVPCDPG